MRIAVLIGPSQYGNLRLQTKLMCEALERRGVEIHMLELLTPQFRDQVAEAQRTGVDAIYSATPGWPARIGPQHLGDLLDCPYIAFSVDPPAFLQHELDLVPERSIIFCTCHSHKDYLEKIYPPGRFRELPVLPPPGLAIQDSEPEDATTFEKNRDIEILFTGSLRPTGKTKWEDTKGLTKQILDDAFDICLKTECLPTHVGIEGAIDEKAPNWDQEQRLTFVRKWTSAVHENTHATRRMAAMKKIASAKIPVNVYGLFWEKRLYRFKSFIYGGEGSYRETLDLLPRSRIVINCNSNFVAGGHDRVFSAQLAGAAVVSDVSTYYEDQYKDGESIAFYRWTELDKLPDILLDLKNNPEKAARIAQGGQTIAKQLHTWDERAEQVLTYLGNGSVASKAA